MEDFIAVLVLYKTDLRESVTFTSLIKGLKKCGQVLELIVYDNTPTYNHGFNDGDIYTEHENITIIYKADPVNSGVSAAYNFGQQVGKSKRKKWILLLDQDTEFAETAIDSYMGAVTKYPDDNLFAPIMMVNNRTIISPCRFRYMRGFSLQNINPGINSLQELSVINCGMCISIAAFEKNNGYNSDIKLDFSDHDFVKRFKETNGNQFIVLDMKVQHQLSSASKNSLESDLIRFGYYLEGACNIKASNSEKVFLKTNALIRAVKLSLVHLNMKFILKLFK